LEQWLAATASEPAFKVTGKLRQVNPFTQEVIYFNSPGSGEWSCPDHAEPVVFHYAAGVICFHQFSDLGNPQLVALAGRLKARLEHYRVGSV
jgi:hypothetical protein